MFCWSRSTHGDPNFKPVVLIRKWKMACHCEVDYFTKLSNLSDKRGMECNWNYWNRWKTMIVHVAISKLDSNDRERLSHMLFDQVRQVQSAGWPEGPIWHSTYDVTCVVIRSPIHNLFVIDFAHHCCPIVYIVWRNYPWWKILIYIYIYKYIYICINLSLSFSSACVISIWFKSLMFHLPFLHAFVLQKSSVITFLMSQASHFHMIPMIGDMWNPKRNV